MPCLPRLAGAAGACYEAGQSAEPLLYPMYVVSVPDFLDMRRAEPHQVLRRSSIAVELPAGQTAIFVSHQWRGLRHPDSDFRQLAALQGTLRRAIAGSLLVQPEICSLLLWRMRPSVRAEDWRDAASWHLWYDFFSVPQPTGTVVQSGHYADLHTELGKAVSSLAGYVDACRWFLVLAPALRHEDGSPVDYASWKRRGWCRFERLARALSPVADTTVLVLKDEHTIWQASPHECCSEPVGFGAFSDERDRGRLGRRVKALLQCKLQHLLDQGKVEACRQWLGLRASIVRGLLPDWRIVRPPGLPSLDDCDTLEGFLRLFCLRSPTQEVQGTYPLLLAAGLGDCRAMEAMMKSRACMLSRQRRDVPAAYLYPSMQALHVAACHDQVSAVRMLLGCRMDVGAPTKFRDTPLHIAAMTDSVGVMGVLMQRRAEVDARNFLGMSPLEVAALHGKLGAAECLLQVKPAQIPVETLEKEMPTQLQEALKSIRVGLGQDRLAILHGREAGASPAGNADGVTALHLMAVFASAPEEDMVRALLRGRVSLCGRFEPVRWGGYWKIIVSFQVLHCLGKRSFWTRFVRSASGATPLIYGAAVGNASFVTLLLALRADPEARNARGERFDQLICLNRQ